MKYLEVQKEVKFTGHEEKFRGLQAKFRGPEAKFRGSEAKFRCREDKFRGPETKFRGFLKSIWSREYLLTVFCKKKSSSVLVQCFCLLMPDLSQNVLPTVAVSSS